MLSPIPKMALSAGSRLGAYTNLEEPNSYDVSPDGARFLMIKPDPEESAPARVKVVLNWFEEVKRRVPGAK